MLKRMLLFLGGKLSSILEYINTYFQSYYYFKFSEMIRVKEESSSISSLKDEFTQRIAEAEKKVQLACKERDAAKKVMEV